MPCYFSWESWLLKEVGIDWELTRTLRSKRLAGLHLRESGTDQRHLMCGLTGNDWKERTVALCLLKKDLALPSLTSCLHRCKGQFKKLTQTRLKTVGRPESARAASDMFPDQVRED